MFTNLFGNFLNVKEHFEMFQWNNQKCFQTNSSENILKCSKLFFPNISGNYPEHWELFSNNFSLDTLKYFQTCSGTFWKVLMVHSEMFPNKLFRNLFFRTFLATIQNIVSCSRTFIHFGTFECSGIFKKVPMEHSESFWMFTNILKTSNGTF